MSVERESHKAPPPLAEFILGPRFARTRGRAPPPQAGEENKALPHIFLISCEAVGARLVRVRWSDFGASCYGVGIDAMIAGPLKEIAL